MDPFRDDIDFAAELRALRPASRPAFTAELDERAAAGFPRRAPTGGSPLSRLAARLRTLPPGRLVLSAGATALASLAAVTAIVAVKEPHSNSSFAGRLAPSQSLFAGRLAPSARRPAPLPHSGTTGPGMQYEAMVPTVRPEVAPSKGSSGAGGSAAAASESGSYNGSFNLSELHRKTGPYVFRARHRDVERSAQMVLGADPSAVADDAAKVFQAVHAYDGIVLSSSISGGAAGDARARFELLIPSAKLGDALAAFSGIAEVRSRHDATDDITSPTVSLGEDLQDSRAKIAGLLVQLAGADSAAERAEVEAELQAERRHAASLRSQVTKLTRRANLSRVSLRIESGDTSASDGSGSSWGAGDALGDAGHILGIAAGIVIVALAILAPLALIVLLIWLARRAWVRRGRERVLD